MSSVPSPLPSAPLPISNAEKHKCPELAVWHTVNDLINARGVY